MVETNKDELSQTGGEFCSHGNIPATCLECNIAQAKESPTKKEPIVVYDDYQPYKPSKAESPSAPCQHGTFGSECLYCKGMTGEHPMEQASCAHGNTFSECAQCKEKMKGVEEFLQGAENFLADYPSKFIKEMLDIARNYSKDFYMQSEDGIIGNEAKSRQYYEVMERFDYEFGKYKSFVESQQETTGVK
ncbi:MAG: hypothetical protein Q8P20_10250 [bacterium]|nr:hypothetical protein [bacterium]